MFEIIIHDIPEEGLSINADKNDDWVRLIIDENIQEYFLKDDKFDVSLFINKNDDNIIISGDVRYSYHPICDRCLEPMRVENTLKISLYLLKMEHDERKNRRSKGKDKELVEEPDDTDVTFYSGDIFDLGELIREQFVLNLPLKNLCSENCKGLCFKCGANLNKEKCRCKNEKTDPRWAALAKLKGEKK